MSALERHLATGLTTVCRCWAVVRRDGETLGFTDHDLPIAFDGIDFRADAGLTARALSQTTGLSVDNTETVGALSDDAITEADITAGRYDGAEVRAWLVNWCDVAQRQLQFRGTIGELRRAGGAFQADLRGLTEALNHPQGRVYQTPCAAILGDGRCRFDLGQTGFSMSRAVETVETESVFSFAGFTESDAGWFARGRLRVMSGAAEGLVGVIKRDGFVGGVRRIELWQRLGGVVAAGDMLRLEAGCDKRAETCKKKFSNFINFQGFPNVPGEDWLVSVPTKSGANTGGSLRG